MTGNCRAAGGLFGSCSSCQAVLSNTATTAIASGSIMLPLTAGLQQGTLSCLADNSQCVNYGLAPFLLRTGPWSA